jgi:hypothetical protein
MRSFKSLSDQLFRLNRLFSWWHAGEAVRHKVSLDDFLNYWLCFYLAQCRHSLLLMPFAVAIEQGKPIKIPNPKFDTCSKPDPIGEDSIECSKIETRRHEFAREFTESEAEFARLMHSRHAIQEQQEALEAQRIEAISRGEMSAPKTIQRHTERRRRPRQTFPWSLIAGLLAILLLILIETGQLAWPMLDLLGVDTTRLGSEWSRNPIGVLLGFGMALAATAALFYVWHVLIDRAVVLCRSWDTAPVVLMRRVAGVFLLCCGLLVCTILIANLRHSSINVTNDVKAFQHGQDTGTDMGTGVFIVLTLLIPFTAASLHYTIAQSPYWQRRRDTAAQQARWYRDEDARLVPVETFADHMASLEKKRVGIEQQLTKLQIERRTLEKRAHAAEQQRVKQREQARQCAVVFANWLIAALEEKRFYFIKAANKANAFHLLSAGARDHSQPQMKPWRIVHPQLPAGKNGHGN